MAGLAEWGGRAPTPALYKEGEGAMASRSANPASTACHPKRMEDTWRTCRIEGTGEATSPHPVIMGCGRLEDRDPAPRGK